MSVKTIIQQGTKILFISYKMTLFSADLFYLFFIILAKQNIHGDIVSKMQFTQYELILYVLKPLIEG